MTSLLHIIEDLSPQKRTTTLSDTYILGFDTETTGVSYGKDSIVSASLVLRNPAQGFEADVTGYWEINPQMEVNPFASRVNGFTTQYLQEHGEDQKTAITRLSDIIVAAQLKNIPLLAYNAPFDIHMLNGDLKKIGSSDLVTLTRDKDADNLITQTERELLIIDPLVIDRTISKRRGPRKLVDTTEYYGVHPHGSFHNALADTVAAVDLVEPMTRLFPQVAAVSLENLMAFQRDGYQAWKQQYNEYLKKNNRRLIQGSWL
ncbi:exonuclease domain-containing protein [Alloscardovia criceti]|uniref:exonuclease domain-containing protein n=1 Tax=Alloscardovia criceti TaxID=356828 RepID=UPI000374E4B4|nr:exonuclease domain-containing protein [Alloscardovia criceti]